MEFLLLQYNEGKEVIIQVKSLKSANIFDSESGDSISCTLHLSLLPPVLPSKISTALVGTRKDCRLRS